MLVEIPDVVVLLGWVLAFAVGLFSLFVFSSVRSYTNPKSRGLDPTILNRLEYYEKQIIGMKLQLDALASDGPGVGRHQAVEGSESALNKPKPTGAEPLVIMTRSSEPAATPNTQKTDVYSELIGQRRNAQDAVNQVLELITEGGVTSRDIRTAVGRTREHTSRLMKRLFEDGYVKRNTDTKPYTYSITDKGRARLESSSGAA